MTSFASLKSPQLPVLAPKQEVKKSEISVHLEALMEDFAAKFRKRSMEMGRDPANIPQEEMVIAYKFKNGIKPLNGVVTEKLAGEIKDKFLGMKGDKAAGNIQS